MATAERDRERGPLVWDLYEIPENHEGNFKAKCRVCGALISGSRKTTSNFLTHLRRLHNDEYLRLESRRAVPFAIRTGRRRQPREEISSESPSMVVQNNRQQELQYNHQQRLQERLRQDRLRQHQLQLQRQSHLQLQQHRQQQQHQQQHEHQHRHQHPHQQQQHQQLHQMQHQQQIHQIQQMQEASSSAVHTAQENLPSEVIVEELLACQSTRTAPAVFSNPIVEPGSSSAQQASQNHVEPGSCVAQQDPHTHVDLVDINLASPSSPETEQPMVNHRAQHQYDPCTVEGHTAITNHLISLLAAQYSGPASASKIVESREFSAFVQALNPDYCLPSVDELVMSNEFQTKTYASEAYSRLTDARPAGVTIEVHFGPYEGSITMNPLEAGETGKVRWFIAVIVHYIDSRDWSQQSVMLAWECINTNYSEIEGTEPKAGRMFQPLSSEISKVFKHATEQCAIPAAAQCRIVVINRFKKHTNGGNRTSYALPWYSHLNSLNSMKDTGDDAGRSDDGGVDTDELSALTTFGLPSYYCCFEISLHNTVTAGLKYLPSAVVQALRKAHKLMKAQSSKPTMDDKSKPTSVTTNEASASSADGNITVAGNDGNPLTVKIERDNSQPVECSSNSEGRQLPMHTGTSLNSQMTDDGIAIWNEQIKQLRVILAADSNIFENAGDMAASRSGTDTEGTGTTPASCDNAAVDAPISSTDNLLTKTEAQLLTSLCDLLAPFEEAADTLINRPIVNGLPNDVPTSFIVPCLRGLRVHLASMKASMESDNSCDQTSSCLKIMCDIFEKTSEKYLTTYSDDSILITSAVLDPRFQLRWCHSEEEATAVRSKVISFIASKTRPLGDSDIPIRPSSVNSSSTDGPQLLTSSSAGKRDLEGTTPGDQHSHKRRKLFSFMTPVKTENKTPAALKVEDELRNYLLRPVESFPSKVNSIGGSDIEEDGTMDEDGIGYLMVYWRANTDLFPTLAEAASQCFSAPASLLARGEGRIVGGTATNGSSATRLGELLKMCRDNHKQQQLDQAYGKTEEERSVAKRFETTFAQCLAVVRYNEFSESTEDEQGQGEGERRDEIGGNSSPDLFNFYSING